jgi:hypothetical protein
MKTISKKCAGCNRTLYFENRSTTRKHYRFCPDCGTDSDERMQVKTHSFWLYKMGIIIIPWIFMVFQTYMFRQSYQPGATGHNFLEFIMLMVFPLIILLFIYLSSSFCPHCLDFNRRKYKYCPNCGRQK